jgi:hypothetical protein
MGVVRHRRRCRRQGAAISGLSPINLWEPVRERYPGLFAFYGMLSSALPTTACVERVLRLHLEAALLAFK